MMVVYSAVLKLLLFIKCVHLSSPGTHSLQYLYTTLTQRTHFPQFTAVGLVDGEQFVYYDSTIRKMIPKTEWMKKIEDDDPHYWARETQFMTDQEDSLQVTLNRAKLRFNHTKGNHTAQRMYGCELNDDDDGITGGYDQYGYDGEDFISLNIKTKTWTTVNDEDWDPQGIEATHWKDFLEKDCIEQLNKFMTNGRETLARKGVPEVSVFQKHNLHQEVVCHTTGFFPKALNITWQKDGEDVHEDVELRETLPNQDGSFQKRSILNVSAEELQKHTYTCVVQHSSLEKELVREVPKGGRSAGVRIAIITAVVAALVAVVAGIVVLKKKNSGFRLVLSNVSSKGDSSTNNLYSVTV